MLKNKEKEWKSFNMLDQENNNLYKYESQIIYGGVKRHLLQNDTITKGYIVIVSAMIKPELVLMNKFDKTE
tara:strand:+ start:1298 stop:1510 length:213 start_codon:yes stop_codon:yes gene_type:complete